jgi:hypothetical protein
MGLDQTIYIQKDYNKFGSRKDDYEEHYFRNFYTLHNAIEKQWVDRGRPGENVYGVKNPDELIDMGIALQASDLEPMRDIEVPDSYKKEYNEVLTKSEQAFKDARRVDYIAS